MLMKTIAKRSPDGDWHLVIRQVWIDRSFGVLALLLLTAIWGSTFVVLKSTAQVPTSMVLLVRFAVAGLCLGPFLQWRWATWRAGLELGFWLVLGYSSQTIGLLSTTVNRSAFITTLYVVLMPLGLRLLGYALPKSIGLSAGLAVAGVALLSQDGAPPNWGDLWTLGTAACYAVYIWRMGQLAQDHDALALSGSQTWCAGLLSLVWASQSDGQWLTPAGFGFLPWAALLYLGAIATGLGTCLHTWGQQRVPATQASLMFTLEPVWASVWAFVMLQEQLGIQGWVGAALILAGVLVSQYWQD
jgi:drug/metabolite transporter (DMT)-like permease